MQVFLKFFVKFPSRLFCRLQTSRNICETLTRHLRDTYETITGRCFQKTIIVPLSFFILFLAKQPSIQSCSDEAWNQADKHSPTGLHKVVFLLMICGIHVLCTRQTDGFHIGEQHPVQYEAVVPIDIQPHAVADAQCRPKIIRARQPYNQ